MHDALKDGVGLGRLALDLDCQDAEQDDLDGGARRVPAGRRAVQSFSTQDPTTLLTLISIACWTVQRASKLRNKRGMGSHHWHLVPLSYSVGNKSAPEGA